MKARNSVKRRPHGERGQVLFLFVGIVTVFLVMAAIVVDLSLWLAERRDVQKAADLAAAAGALDLPQNDGSAVQAACDIANANGFGTGDCSSGDPVEIQLLCNSGRSGIPGLCADPPGGGTSDCNIGDGCDTISVTVHGQGPALFSSVFGITVSDAAVSSGAAAGVTVDTVILDTVVLLDASRKMSGVCPTPAPGTPCTMRAEAIQAANGFVDLLAADSNTLSQVAEAAFNFCYHPPFTYLVGGQDQCLSQQHIIGLTNNTSALHETINDNIAWGGRNICVGLLKAQELFDDPAAQTDPRVRKSILLLTDGDNNFFYGGSTTYPPAACHASSDASQAVICSAALQGEREMDVKTYQLAEMLKADDVDIYVVAITPCGNDDGRTQNTPGYCSGIGDTASDNTADQRLLKCVASSSTQYFRVTSMAGLPDVFRQVAGAILGRRLLQ